MRRRTAALALGVACASTGCVALTGDIGLTSSASGSGSSGSSSSSSGQGGGTSASTSSSSSTSSTGSSGTGTSSGGGSSSVMDSTDVVSGGKVSTAANKKYKLVFTVGEPVQAPVKATNTKYELHDGLAGRIGSPP
jgi:hypothetical protein